MKIRRIEIDFPVPVELPPGWEQALDGLLCIVTKHYEQQRPYRRMWPAGHGAKPLNADYTEFDHEVYGVDICERQALEHELLRRGILAFCSCGHPPSHHQSADSLSLRGCRSCACEAYTNEHETKGTETA
jgi:hypothetical protein